MLGFETSDDAAVYRLNDEQAVLLTLDFFTPIVDDPYDFGRITAANALSDIYAMGGTPLTALNLLAFPCSLGAEVVGEVLRGGADACAEADTLIVGGHTIDDAEPKYGLSVMGTAHPERIWRNVGARIGDVIVLTKPLGTGIIGTAIKRGLIDDADTRTRAAVASMATLNRAAAEAAADLDVHACTDVTGFGLVGHLHEMCTASEVGAHIELDAVPLLPGAAEFAAEGICPGRTADLIAEAEAFVMFGDSEATTSVEAATVDQAHWLSLLCDPQTSGGLLLALSPQDAARYVERMGGAAHEIGTFVARQSSTIHVV